MLRNPTEATLHTRPYPLSIALFRALSDSTLPPTPHPTTILLWCIEVDLVPITSYCTLPYSSLHSILVQPFLASTADESVATVFPLELWLARLRAVAVLPFALVPRESQQRLTSKKKAAFVKPFLQLLERPIYTADPPSALHTTSRMSEPIRNKKLDLQTAP